MARVSIRWLIAATLAGGGLVAPALLVSDDYNGILYRVSYP